MHLLGAAADYGCLIAVFLFLVYLKNEFCAKLLARGGLSRASDGVADGCRTRPTKHQEHLRDGMWDYGQIQRGPDEVM
jgi:hypothetical protein